MLLRTRTHTRWLLVVILLVATIVRVYGLYNLSPPGPAHDEVANWLIDRSILAGEHAIYFTQAYGHEPGFHYVQAAFVALLGDHILALRLPAAFAGLLQVAVTYALARRLFGRRVAVVAAGLLAVLFWPVFYSRLGLRAIFLPLASGISAYLWWFAWQSGAENTESQPSTRAAGGIPRLRLPGSRSLLGFSLAGLFAGLSLYTYMAARALPIFYFLYTAYLFIFHGQSARRRWRGLLLFWATFALVAAPLIWFLLGNPAAEFRISEVDAPLQALLAGNPRPAVDNFVDILGMFGFRGDPLWRQNVAPAPVFDPLTALFFYACLLLLFLHARNSRYFFLLLWVFIAFIPSLVTIDAPSSIRIINILPVLTILPAIVIHRLGALSTEKWGLSTGGVENSLLLFLLLVLFSFHLVRTSRAIYITWPSHEEVTFVWQEALTDAAAYLDHVPAAGVAIGGWSPDTMDAPTMDLTLRRDDLQTRHFDPRESFVIPGGMAPELPVRVIHPTVLPLSPLLAQAVDNLGITAVVRGTFTEYLLPAMPDVRPDFPSDVRFGDEVQFLGHSYSSDCDLEVALPCQVITYWRVLSPPATPRQFFLHALDDTGELIAAGDGLGAPAAYWHSGDLIIQAHQLAGDGVAPYTLRLGVYNPDNGQRLLTAEGTDQIVLP